MKNIPKPADQQLLVDEPPLARMIPSNNLIWHLRENIKNTINDLQSLTEQELLYRYAPDKYSIKEIVIHMTDMERIYTYRMLRIARNDPSPMDGFDAEAYVKASGADLRTIKDLLDELSSQRQATITLLNSIPVENFSCSGLVNGHSAIVSALAYHIAGHELHHMKIIKERYLNGLVLLNKNTQATT
jgi:hypothetical protein